MRHRGGSTGRGRVAGCLLLGMLILLQPGCVAAVAGPNTPTATPPPTYTAAPHPAAPSTPTAVPIAKPTAGATARPLARPTAPPTALPTPTGLPRKAPPAVGGPLARIIVNGNPATGCAALTFDMGEKAAGSTALVLDTLKQNGVHAIFMLTGQWAEANPALVRRIVAEGHEVGDHSYDHPDFTKLSEAEMFSQLDRTEAVVRSIAGVSLKPYFRPPFGAYDDRVRATLAKRGYHMLYWSLDSADWRNEFTVEDVIARVTSKAGAGDIVVFHGYAEKTARALPVVLQRLKARGLCLRTLSDVL